MLLTESIHIVVQLVFMSVKVMAACQFHLHTWHNERFKLKCCLGMMSINCFTMHLHSNQNFLMGSIKTEYTHIFGIQLTDS